MKLEKINPWITMATNIGVLVGIVLLLLEVNQNTTALEIQADDANFSQWTELNRLVAGSTELAEIVVRGNVDLTSLDSVEELQYGHYQINYLNVIEHSFRAAQRGIGVDGEEVYAAVLADNLENPGARAIYENYKNFFGEDFIAWADQILNENES